jgi:Xaa-Pro aminopeptidase
MTDERVTRIVAALHETGADWAVLSSADAVAYACGHAPSVETGASPFAAGPDLALVGRSGAVGLLAANPGPCRADAIERYDAYGADQADAPNAAYAAALARLAAALGVGGVLAMQPATHPRAVDAGLGAASRDIVPALRRQRATKTAAELAALRHAAAVTAIGQRAFVANLAAGGTELDLFGAIRGAMENAAGARLAVAGDLVSGRARTATIGGWPNGRRIVRGDAVIADLAPCVDGYWADSCATTVLGPADEGQRRLFTAARTALDLALSIMRPGLTLAELHAAVRGCVQRHGFDYPHHTGHSIGTAVHEHPRVHAHAGESLRQDMVLMIEPGAYHPELGGARTEWMVHVTATGCAPIEPFELVAAV